MVKQIGNPITTPTTARQALAVNFKNELIEIEDIWRGIGLFFDSLLYVSHDGCEPVSFFDPKVFELKPNNVPIPFINDSRNEGVVKLWEELGCVDLDLIHVGQMLPSESVNCNL